MAYGLAVPFLGTGSRGFYWYYGIGRRIAASRAARAMAGVSRDTVVLHTDHSWIPLWARGSGPVQTVFRDVPAAVYAEARGLSRRLVRRLHDLEMAQLERCDWVFTTSVSCAEHYVSSGVSRSKVVVVGTGVKSLTGDLASKDYASGRTLFVAKVRLEDKGLDLLIDAFSLARQENPHLRLDCLVPADYHRADLPGVQFHARVSDAELSELYAEAALFAMPALFEPWGLVYLEAQKLGVPCLGLRRGAFPELVQQGESGFIVESPSTRLVADALLKAHASPDRLAEMGVNGRRFASEFTWQRTTGIMIEAVRSMTTGL